MNSGKQIAWFIIILIISVACVTVTSNSTSYVEFRALETASQICKGYENIEWISVEKQSYSAKARVRCKDNEVKLEQLTHEYMTTQFFIDSVIEE